MLLWPCTTVPSLQGSPHHGGGAPARGALHPGPQLGTATPAQQRMDINRSMAPQQASTQGPTQGPAAAEGADRGALHGSLQRMEWSKSVRCWAGAARTAEQHAEPPREGASPAVVPGAVPADDNMQGHASMDLNSSPPLWISAQNDLLLMLGHRALLHLTRMLNALARDPPHPPPSGPPLTPLPAHKDLNHLTRPAKIRYGETCGDGQKLNPNGMLSGEYDTVWPAPPPNTEHCRRASGSALPSPIPPPHTLPAGAAPPCMAFGGLAARARVTV